MYGRQERRSLAAAAASFRNPRGHSAAAAAAAVVRALLVGKGSSYSSPLLHVFYTEFGKGIKRVQKSHFFHSLHGRKLHHGNV